MKENKVKELEENDLKEMERHYEKMPYGFFVAKIIFSVDGSPCDCQSVYVNRNVSHIVKIPKERLLKDTFLTLFPKLKKSSILPYYNAAYHGITREQDEDVLFMKKYLSVTYYQYEYGYVACILKDNTKSHFYEDALRSTMSAYREIYFVNLDKNYYRMIYPYTDKEAESGDYEKSIDKRIKTQLILNDDEENIRNFLSIQHIRNTLIERDSVEYKYRRRLKGEIYEWCLTSFTVGYRKNGIPQTATMVIRSIDELVRQQEKQKELLDQAVKRAEAENSAKTNFLSTISHDIRTPLNVIVGMSSIAKLYPDDTDKVQNCLDKIHTSSRHLLTLIDEVLDMSKIESGRMELNRTEFAMSDMIKEVVLMTQSMIASKKQTLNFSLKNLKHEKVIGDEKRLMQVLLNIISNAVKYTEN